MGNPAGGAASRISSAGAHPLLNALHFMNFAQPDDVKAYERKFMGVHEMEIQRFVHWTPGPLQERKARQRHE
jgi:hypothetical protein